MALWPPDSSWYPAVITSITKGKSLIKYCVRYNDDGITRSLFEHQCPLKPALPAQTDGSSRIGRVRGRVANKSDLLKPPPAGVSFQLNKVLSSMRRDSVGLIVKNDSLILEVAKLVTEAQVIYEEATVYEHMQMRRALRMLVTCGLATVSQILALNEHQLETLADFMGHDLRVHREYYQLPDTVQRLTKLSRLFLSLERGNLVSQHGKSLEELHVTGEGFTSDEDSSDSGDSCDPALEDSVDARRPPTQTDPAPKA
ncbi:uncharacterized protein LOC117287542 [Asterias rubens]|uniref:uncharacterized protein LOC117287542 n=1 Tax=Asterias rubens TaxID=7604 RepID=UPI0014553D52|nr:uncharacterized protein LOC117287542 [Asterias rubens]